jgi:hypothetical protein
MGNRSLIKRPDSGDNKEEAGTENKKRNNFTSFVKKHPVFSTIVIALFILIVFYFWMSFQSRRENNRVIRTATTQIDELNQEKLLLLSRPMVWAIRAELMRGNMEQIDLLFADMVREPNFRNIFLVNTNGEITVSTNRQQEGQPASQFVSEQLLSAENSIVQQDENSLILSAPVLGFDRRLGTLIIQYQPRNVDLRAR